VGGFAPVGELAGGILADGFQQPVPGLRTGWLGEEKGLAGQPVHHIQGGGPVAAAAHFGRLG